MKYFFTSLTAFSIVMFGYWLGGGSFERNVSLRSAYVIALLLAILSVYIMEMYSCLKEDKVCTEKTYEGL